MGADEVRRALIPPAASGDAFDWLAATRLPLEEVERRYITAVMDKAGSKARAAEILNVDVSTLYRRQRGQRS